MRVRGRARLLAVRKKAAKRVVAVGRRPFVSLSSANATRRVINEACAVVFVIKLELEAHKLARPDSNQVHNPTYKHRLEPGCLHPA